MGDEVVPSEVKRQTAIVAHDGGASPGEGQRDDQVDPSQGISGAVPVDEGIDLGEVSQILVIPHRGGSGGQAVLVVSRIGPHLLELYLRVPFVSPIEAEITRSSLSPFQDTAEIHRELIVNDLFMRVRWVAEDPVNLLALLARFILDLYVIFHVVQLFMPVHASTS
ncbi:hypothetical protein H920_19485 [Fukomys damarensis]|uniref:Uncharacterized protein n=1 Tax=Fukomys damarensis TaxID=885580 RepID=A0A091D8E3_FUKDA|nr:hypothetical protein H920_19485 [Fukomys damarensis]